MRAHIKLKLWNTSHAHVFLTWTDRIACVERFNDPNGHIKSVVHTEGGKMHCYNEFEEVVGACVKAGVRLVSVDDGKLWINPAKVESISTSGWARSKSYVTFNGCSLESKTEPEALWAILAAAE